MVSAASWIAVTWARPQPYPQTGPSVDPFFPINSNPLDVGWSFSCRVYHLEPTVFFSPLLPGVPMKKRMQVLTPSRRLVVILYKVSEGNPQWNTGQEIGDGGAGFYFRSVKVAFPWQGDYLARERYELHLPPWVAIALLLAYPAIFVPRQARNLLRRKRGLCVKCGYNLTGNTSGICPECGQRR